MVILIMKLISVPMQSIKLNNYLFLFTDDISTILAKKRPFMMGRFYSKRTNECLNIYFATRPKIPLRQTMVAWSYLNMNPSVHKEYSVFHGPTTLITCICQMHFIGMCDYMAIIFSKLSIIIIGRYFQSIFYPKICTIFSIIGFLYPFKPFRRFRVRNLTKSCKATIMVFFLKIPGL